MTHTFTSLFGASLNVDPSTEAEMMDRFQEVIASLEITKAKSGSQTIWMLDGTPYETRKEAQGMLSATAAGLVISEVQFGTGLFTHA